MASDAREPEVMPDVTGETMVDLLKGGAMIAKIENDTLSMAALARPRNEKRILDAALEALEIAPDLAERTYYSLPFKKHIKGCRDRKNCDCEVEWVRGVSVKGALDLGRRWGNCTATVRILSEDEDGCHMEGVFLDYESNFRVTTPRAVSKWTTWNGQRQKMFDDRYEKLMAANASKALRNAILNGIPDYLVQRYYDKAREIAVGLASGKPDEPRHLKILSSFALLGVERPQLEQLIGNTIEDVTDEQVANLRGVKNAILAGEQTIEEIFADGPKPDAKPAESMTDGGATLKDRPKDEPPKSSKEKTGKQKAKDADTPPADEKVCIECGIPESDHAKNSGDHMFVGVSPKTGEVDASKPETGGKQDNLKLE
jgi:hypothetical protein